MRMRGAVAGLLMAAPAAAQPAVIAEAQAFMAAYAKDLAAGDRAAVAARYSRAGAYALGFAPKRFDAHAVIVANYAGSGWQKPAAFAWRDLSYEPIGPDAVAVTGGFDWTAEQAGEPVRFAYTGILRREAGTLRIRIEHENPLPAGQ
jgi:ketosteroid isomerase-like protein